MGGIKDKVRDLLVSITKERDLELVDVDYKKEGSEYFLRIFIDSKEGIKHEDCKGVSEEISTLLDLYDLISDSYILEVSSPGLDRPLKGEGDFLRFLGEEIVVKTFHPIQGKKEWQGRLLNYKEESIYLQVGDSELQIPCDLIASARLHVEF